MPAAPLTAASALAAVVESHARGHERDAASLREEARAHDGVAAWLRDMAARVQADEDTVTEADFALLWKVMDGSCGLHAVLDHAAATGACGIPT